MSDISLGTSRYRTKPLLWKTSKVRSEIAFLADRWKLPPTPTESPGTIIGPFKLLQVIGEGGMGVDYMAEQTEPVVRLVAVKIRPWR